MLSHDDDYSSNKPCLEWRNKKLSCSDREWSSREGTIISAPSSMMHLLPRKSCHKYECLKGKERRQLILHSPHLTRFVVPRSRAGLNYIKHGNSYNVSPFGVATNQRHLSKVVRRQHQKNAKMHPTKPPAWSGHRPRSARSLLSAFCHVCPFFMFAVLVVL